MESGQNLTKDCLAPSSAGPIDPVPIFDVLTLFVDEGKHYFPVFCKTGWCKTGLSEQGYGS